MRYLQTYENWSKRDRIRQIKQDETIHVYEDDDVKVIIPKTLESACLYGKGARWCYVSNDELDMVKNGNLKEEDTTFSAYNDSDVFYIFIMKKENKKYTFRFETGDFRDEQDNDCDFPEFMKKYPKLKELLISHVKNGTYVKYIYPFIHLDFLNGNNDMFNKKIRLRIPFEFEGLNGFNNN
jgi:hypothetical protein